jgi:hypothetical protein
MEPPVTGHDVVSREKSTVHNWRVAQLERLGIPGSLAEVYADRIDWHQVARLVKYACRDSPSVSSADVARTQGDDRTH